MFFEHGLFLFTFLDKFDIMLHMIGKILCKIGIHSCVASTKFFPHIHAKIVTRFLSTYTCRRCGKVISSVDYHYDPETGEPV